MISKREAKQGLYSREAASPNGGRASESLLKSRRFAVQYSSVEVAWSNLEDASIGCQVDVFHSFFLLEGQIFSAHRRMRLHLPSQISTDEYCSKIILSSYSAHEGVLRATSELELITAKTRGRYLMEKERLF